MDKTSLIASKARKVVRHVFRKRKRGPGLKLSTSRETAFSANLVLPSKSKRSSLNNMNVRSELRGSTRPTTRGSELQPDRQQEPHVFWEGKGSRSLEDLQVSHNTARKLVELQLDNDRLKRDVRDLEKQLKDVKRQLKQEREYYEEQRWAYVQEIRATIKESLSVATQTREYIDSDDEGDDTLANELRRVRQMFYKQRDISCRLSEKFLRLRDDRDRLSERLKRLEIVYTTVIDELLKHIAEVRVYFASIKKGVLLERSAVASLVDRNAKLGYNNAILQLEILKYEKRLETMKSQAIDCSDGREVEKFLARCRSSKLLAACGGGDASNSSIQVTRRGSVINIPVAIMNGNRVETKLAPLFSVVRLNELNEKESKYSKSKSKVTRGRRTKSVPSKVWRTKYEVRPSKSFRKFNGLSVPTLRQCQLEVASDSSSSCESV